jgi:hypothetical protein
MSSLNLGNATVGYAYKYPLKGSAFNKVFRNILSPGIYNGGILSYVANNISVTAYDALFNTNTNQLLAVHTDSTIDLSGTAPTGFGLGSITTLTPYIAMSFTWADSTTTYPDYLFSDNSILSNPTYLIIGKATFSGSVVIGFDYSEATYPPVYNSTSKVLQVRGGLTSESTLQGTQLISTVPTGTPPIAVTSTTKVVNLHVDHADTATNALYSINFDYVIDSNVKFLAWQSMTSGCTKVLIKTGTWTLASGGINLTTTGTKVIVGETGSQLVCSSATYGLQYSTIPTTLDYRMVNVNVSANKEGTYALSVGFYNCTNLTECTGTGTGTGTDSTGFGFYNYSNLTSCVGTGIGELLGCGFNDGVSVINCTGSGLGSGPIGVGFAGSYKCLNNKTGACTSNKYDNSYASADNSAGCADTAAGGWNS